MFEIVLALFGATLAYVVGREQGRNQTRFEKQVEVAGRIRDMLQAIESDLYQLPRYEQDWNRDDFSKGVVQKYKRVVTYGTANAFWLPPQIDFDMQAVVGQFCDIVEYLQTDEGYSDLASNFVAYPRALTLAENINIEAQMGRIDDYTERLLGHRLPLWKAVLVELWESNPISKRITPPPRRSRRP